PQERSLLQANAHFALWPRWMPDAEELSPSAPRIERRVTLHQPLRERASDARYETKRSVGIQLGAILERAPCPGIHDRPAQTSAPPIVFIADVTVTIRQTKRRRPESHGEPVRQPFREKMNSRLAAVPDVSADVKKIVRRNRSKQPRRQP